MGWLSRLLGREAVRDLATIRHGCDRRTFLKGALLGSVAVATVDVEQLLWTPKTQIVVPGPVRLADQFEVAMDWSREDMGLAAITHVDAEGRPFNTFITPDWIAREALALLKDKLQFYSRASGRYDIGFDGARVGTTVQVRKPALWTVQADSVLDPLPLVCETETVTLDQCGVSMETSRECQMTRDEYRERMIRPAVASLAHHVKKSKMNVFSGLALPEGMDGSVAHDDGLSLRGVQYHDLGTDQQVFRLDVLGGHSDVLDQQEG